MDRAKGIQTCSIALLLWVACCIGVPAQSGKPVLRVEKDGFPSGSKTPEGAACDLARALINRDLARFKQTCIPPFGEGQGRKDYAAFLKQVTQYIRTEAGKPVPSSSSPMSITKVFAARSLSKNGPASYGYAAFGFKDVKFVDVEGVLHDGKQMLNRTLVLQSAAGKWYVHPLPSTSPLLSDGLNKETASTRDFSEAYTIKK